MHPPQHNAQKQHGYNAPKKKPNIEDMFGKTTKRLNKRLEINEIMTQNYVAMLKNFERRMGQIHGMLSQRHPGQFSSETESNLKEYVNAILLRSGSS